MRVAVKKQNYRDFAELSAHSPFIQNWNMRCLSEGNGAAVLQMDIRAEHRNSIGIVHGGVIASLADTACGMALLSAVKPGSGYVTANMSVSYVGVAKGAYLEARAKVISARKRMGFVEAEVVDEAGTLVAVATTTFFLSAEEEKP